DVGDEAGEIDVVRADGQEHEVKLTAGLLPLRKRQAALKLRDLAWHCARARAGPRCRALACRLRTEQTGVDRGAGAGERNVGDREVAIFYRKLECRADLMTIERTVARGAHPTGAVARPIIGGACVACAGIETGAVAAKAGAPRPEIFPSAGPDKPAEANATVVERDGAVGIALAGRNRVPEAGYEYVAHQDLGRNLLHRVVGGGDTDGGNRRPAVNNPKRYVLFARQTCFPRRRLTILEGPGAGGAGGDRARKLDRDAVILRREIIFAAAVALARLHQLARAVDTQAVDHIARPTSTIAGARQPLFCREHTVAGIGGDMTLEIGLVAEETKAVLDLPFDA